MIALLFASVGGLVAFRAILVSSGFVLNISWSVIKT